MNKMRNSFKYIFVVFLLGIFSSCEEVINIDLDSSDSVLVVDGQLMPNQKADLTISYSTDYYQVEEPKYEENAVVILTASNGSSEEMVYKGSGRYVGKSILGKAGLDYTLSISIDGIIREAKSSMMTPTHIISLNPKKSDRGMGAKTNYELEIIFTNNTEEDNYYLIKYIYEDEDGDQETYAALSWEFFAKKEQIDYTGMMTFEEETVVDVEIYSIDEGTYHYYSSLNDVSGEGRGGSSTPYNPKSNFGTNTLGYFRAWSVDKKQIVMPK